MSSPHLLLLTPLISSGKKTGARLDLPPLAEEVVEQAQLALEGSLCPGQTHLPGWLGSLRATCMVASHSAQTGGAEA